MKKRVLSFIIFMALCVNMLAALPVSAADAIELILDEKRQDSLDAMGTDTYTVLADETQYYEFKIRNQSIEVNTGIGFADGFLNLFLGKMTVTVYDAYDEELSSLDIRCGYTGTLSLSLQKGQRYYIKVSSTVAGNYNILATKLTDLGANTWQDATVTESTGETVSAIEAAGDKDWFKFTTDELRSYYYFELENLQADTLRIYLYEYVSSADQLRNTAVSGSNNYISVSKNNTGSFNLQLKENTVYYYCIQCSSDSGKGDYILNVERSADAAGNTMDAAYEIDTDLTYTTSFDGKEDSDWYVFTTADYDAYYHFNYEYLSGSFTAYSEIYDADGNKIAERNNYKGDFTYNAKLEPNSTYYLRIYGNGVGNYNFWLDTKADIYPNEMSLASDIAVDTEYTTSFDGDKDADYVKFTTPDYDAYYHFNYEYLSGSFTAYSEIYDADGNKIAERNNYKGDFTYNAKLKPNSTYYLRIYGNGVGNYMFSVDVSADEFPNELKDAKEIELNTVYSTAFNGEKDSDYAKFTTGEGNAYYHVNYENLSADSITVYSELYDADGNEIAGGNKYGGDFSYSLQLEPNTVYYLRVFGNGVGNYKIAVNMKADEIGDSKEDAKEISVNCTEQSSLESGKDTDWYKIELTESATLQVTLKNESATDGIYCDVYDDRDAVCFRCNYTGRGNSTTSKGELEAGTYYIKVHAGNYSSATGNYTLTVTPCGAGHDYQSNICTRCGQRDPESLKFKDVKDGAWYAEAVKFVAEEGIMSGTGIGIFNPEGTTTRAMVVQVLYNLEGKPAISANAPPFTDIKGQWYTAAVIWAYENGVVNGMTATTFVPEGKITREQFATILYRFSESKGYDVSARANLFLYSDEDEISSYAKDAMSWANAVGYIGGMTATTLGPRGNATRAQMAQIMMRFIEATRK